MPASAVVDIRNTYGTLLIGLIVSVILYGVTIAQTYYRNRDGKVLQGFVAFLFSLDTLHTILCTYSVYWYLVLNFGDVENLDLDMWAVESQTDINTLVGLLVQLSVPSSVLLLASCPNVEQLLCETIVSHIVLPAIIAALGSVTLTPCVLIAAIEACVYHAPATDCAILYVSKVDSTGQGLASPPTATLVNVFIRWYADPATRPVAARHLWVQLFARAQGQYTFPNSSDYPGKRPLSVDRFCAWWRRVIGQVGGEHVMGSVEDDPKNRFMDEIAFTDTPVSPRKRPRTSAPRFDGDDPARRDGENLKDQDKDRKGRAMGELNRVKPDEFWELDIGNTYGILLIGLIVSAILYGVTIAQTYLVLNFGDVENLDMDMWAVEAQTDINTLVGFLVQLSVPSSVLLLASCPNVEQLLCETIVSHEQQHRPPGDYRSAW
ncbi:histone acetylation protein-domain-containing protein [Russula brevipes]|nr:histone acetylation protein-domain-containing protein [Russula brevipes]